MNIFKDNSDDTLWMIDAASPEDLKTKLFTTMDAQGDIKGFVGLALSDPRILICPFEYSDIPAKNLINRIKADMIEILSLPLDEIYFDYQVFSSEKDNISGIYLCAPKSLIDSYLEVTDDFGLIVTKITVDLLKKVEFLVKKIGSSDSRFAVLDFSIPDNIFISVFRNQRCELLRKIHFENNQEAIHEVMQSLRCACTKSQAKSFDYVFCLGDYAGKEEISVAIKRIFHAEIRDDLSKQGVPSGTQAKGDYFRLNLLRDSTFSSITRRKILLAMDSVLLVVFLIAFSLVIRIMIVENKAKTLKASFSPQEVERALQLREQIPSK